MCIIAICERKLTDEEILNCWRFNEDGAGIATTRDGTIMAIKGLMEPREFKKVYSTIAKDVPHIIHFRTASCGYINKQMTHPFIVSKESPNFVTYKGKKPLLFHNGHFEEWKAALLNIAFKTNELPKGEMSDTRAMAMTVAHLGESILDLFSDNRYVILHPNGELNYWGDFIKEDKVLFSNSAYKGIMTFGNKKYYGNTKINF